MRTRNRAPQEKMPDEELSRRILFYGHLANLCAYGCIAGAVLGVLAGMWSTCRRITTDWFLPHRRSRTTMLMPWHWIIWKM